MENFWHSAKLLGVDFTTTGLPERGPALYGNCKVNFAVIVPGHATC